MASNGVEGIQKLLDVHWSTNWSDLPPEIESEVEASFEHVTRARDMIEEQEAED